MVYMFTSVTDEQFKNQCDLLYQTLTRKEDLEFLTTYESQIRETLFQALVNADFRRNHEESGYDFKTLNRMFLKNFDDKNETTLNLIRTASPAVQKVLTYTYAGLLPEDIVNNHVSSFSKTELLNWTGFATLINNYYETAIRTLTLSPEFDAEVFDLYWSQGFDMETTPQSMFVYWFVNSHVPLEIRLEKAIDAADELIKYEGSSARVLLTRLKLGAVTEALRNETNETFDVDSRMPLPWLLNAIRS